MGTLSDRACPAPRTAREAGPATSQLSLQRTSSTAGLGRATPPEPRARSPAASVGPRFLATAELPPVGRRGAGTERPGRLPVVGCFLLSGQAMVIPASAICTPSGGEPLCESELARQPRVGHLSKTATGRGGRRAFGGVGKSGWEAPVLCVISQQRRNLHTGQFSPSASWLLEPGKPEEERARGEATWSLIPLSSCRRLHGLSFGLRSHILFLPPCPVQITRAGGVGMGVEAVERGSEWAWVNPGHLPLLLPTHRLGYPLGKYRRWRGGDRPWEEVPPV